jgi:hypothetical protein
MPGSRTLQIVSLPSRDASFREHALGVAARLPADLDGPGCLRWFLEELRQRYPSAVVRVEGADPSATEATEAVWYVTDRPRPFRIDTSILVPLPRPEAFDVYVERVEEWQTSVQLARLDAGPGLVGREYAATYGFLGLRLTGAFRILAADPPLRVAVEAEGSGITVWYVTRFLEDGESTRVAVHGDYELPDTIIARMVDRLGLERAIGRDVERANESYRRLCLMAAVERDTIRATVGETGDGEWARVLARFEAAQARYRGLLGVEDDGAGLAEAEAALLEARGAIEAVKRAGRWSNLRPGDLPDGS